MTACYKFSYFLDYLDFLLQLFLSPLESLVLPQDTGGHFLQAPAFVLPVKKNCFSLIDGLLRSIFHFIKHSLETIGKPERVVNFSKQGISTGSEPICITMESKYLLES